MKSEKLQELMAYKAVYAEENLATAGKTLAEMEGGSIVPTSGFSSEGETIEFPSIDDIRYFERPIRNSDRTASEVGVLRNGQPSVFGTANLRRMCVDQKSGLSKLSTSAVEFHSKMNLSQECLDRDRIASLAGKTIRCTGFEDGIRRDFTTQQNVASKFPLFEIVE